jgi:hypothetical protein
MRAAPHRAGRETPTESAPPTDSSSTTSIAFLFCAFLGLDLAWPATEDSRILRGLFFLAPWMIVAICAYFYSGRVIGRLMGQVTLVQEQRAAPPSSPGDVVPNINCDEIHRATDDGRV